MQPTMPPKQRAQKAKSQDNRTFEPLGSPAHVSMTALTFGETGAQRAEREEAGIRLPKSRDFSKHERPGGSKGKVPNRYGDKPLILDTPDEGVGNQAQGELDSE